MSEIGDLANAERARLTSVAEIVGGEGGAQMKQLRDIMLSKGQGSTPPVKRGRPSVDGFVEVIDDGRGRGKAQDELSIPYILRGNSQKVQLAGAAALAGRSVASIVWVFLPLLVASTSK